MPFALMSSDIRRLIYRDVRLYVAQLLIEWALDLTPAGTIEQKYLALALNWYSRSILAERGIATPPAPPAP